VRLDAVPSGLTQVPALPGTYVPGYHMPPCGAIPCRFRLPLRSNWVLAPHIRAAL